jgi:hypothetical protein
VNNNFVKRLTLNIPGRDQAASVRGRQEARTTPKLSGKRSKHKQSKTSNRIDSKQKTFAQPIRSSNKQRAPDHQTDYQQRIKSYKHRIISNKHKRNKTKQNRKKTVGLTHDQ